MPIFKVVVEGSGWEEYDVDAPDRETAGQWVEEGKVRPHTAAISLVERVEIDGTPYSN